MSRVLTMRFKTTCQLGILPKLQTVLQLIAKLLSLFQGEFERFFKQRRDVHDT